MPTSKIDLGKIGIMTTGGFLKLGDDTEIPIIDSKMDSSETQNEDHIQVEMVTDGFEFSFQTKRLDFRIFRDITYDKNNWRKLHGLPVIRKRAIKNGKWKSCKN